MIYDHFNPKFPDYWGKLPRPDPNSIPQIPSGTVFTNPVVAPHIIISQQEVDEIKKLIADFRTAVEAAKIVDKLQDNLIV